MSDSIGYSEFWRVQSYNLLVCRVCSAWHKISLDPSLWSVVNLTRQKMSSHLLSTTVQKQPIGLLLDWTNLGKQHLNWLLPRIPQRTLDNCSLP